MQNNVQPERNSPVGGLLESRRLEILRHLEDRLRVDGSLISKDAAVLPECLARADAIITASVDELNRSTDSGADSQPPAPDGGDPPGGSDVLMGVVVRELLRVAVDRPELVPDVLLAFTTVHRNLTSQVFASGDSYDTYILRTADEARRTERRELAREVHDELGHELSIAMYQLELGELYLNQDQAASAERFSRVRGHLGSAMLIVRRLISEFSETPVPEDLQREILSFVDKAGAGRSQVQVTVTGNQLLVPGGHRRQLFLIVREALLNVFTHANAERAVVRIGITSAEITASVQDNGHGFAVVAGADVTPGRGRRGFGLISMQERADSLGGSATISQSPAGTQVEVRIPLP